jgi:hypothetical protein
MTLPWKFFMGTFQGNIARKWIMLKKMRNTVILGLLLLTAAHAAQPGEAAGITSVAGNVGAEYAGMNIGFESGIDSGLLGVLDYYLYSLSAADAWATVAPDGSFELPLPDIPASAFDGPNRGGLCPDETPFLSARLMYLNVKAGRRLQGEATFRLPAAEESMSEATAQLPFVTEPLALSGSCDAGQDFSYDVVLEPGWNLLILDQNLEKLTVGPMTLNRPAGLHVRTAAAPEGFSWVVEED